MEFCTKPAMLHLKVRPGALNEYVVFAARPGVHLEPTLVNLFVQVAQDTGSCIRKVLLAEQRQLIWASTYATVLV